MKSIKAKVLFIIHDVYKKNNELPLGISYLTAILKRHRVDVKICSQDVFHYSNKEMVERFLKNESYDLIGIGFLAARFKETVLNLCKTVNEHKKNAWLVLGGHGPASIPEYFLEKTKADVIAIGEAEETIIELLECKLNNKNLSKIKGIAYRKDGKTIINERRQPIIDLDSIPFPEWSLFPMEEYYNYDTGKNDKAMSMLTSRGCTNRCNFCYRMEKGIRHRSIKNVIKEIKILKEKYGVTFLHMRDELFNFPKKRMLEFCQALKKNNLKIKFTCCARVDSFDEETAIALKESGCTRLSFGTESTDQNVLNLIGKNATIEQNIKALKIAKKIGIAVRLNLLWGNKGDTEKSLRDNVEFIKNYSDHNELIIVRPVTPYPGSVLYYEAIEKGLLSGPDDFFDKFKNSDLLTVNFTNIPNKKFYKLLFEANKELIIDHFMYTNKDMDKANKLIKGFEDLYFEGKVKFRGIKHHVKK